MSSPEEGVEPEQRQRARGAVRVRGPARVRVSPQTLLELYATSEATGKDISEVIEEALAYTNTINRAKLYENLSVRDLMLAQLAARDVASMVMESSSLMEPAINRKISELSNAVNVVDTIYSRAYQSYTQQVKDEFINILRQAVSETAREAVRTTLVEIFSQLYSAGEAERLKEVLGAMHPSVRSEVASRTTSAAFSNLMAHLDQKVSDIANRIVNKFIPFLDAFIEQSITPIEGQIDKAIAESMKKTGYVPKIPTKIKPVGAPEPQPETGGTSQPSTSQQNTQQNQPETSEKKEGSTQ